MSDKVITYSEFIDDIEDVDDDTERRLHYLLGELKRNSYSGLAMEAPGYRRFLVNFCIHLLRKRKVMFCRSKELSEEAMSIWESGEVREPLFSAIEKYDTVDTIFLYDIDDCERIKMFADHYGYEYIIYFHSYGNHFLRLLETKLSDTHKVISIKISEED